MSCQVAWYVTGRPCWIFKFRAPAPLGSRIPFRSTWYLWVYAEICLFPGRICFGPPTHRDSWVLVHEWTTAGGEDIQYGSWQPWTWYVRELDDLSSCCCWCCCCCSCSSSCCCFNCCIIFQLVGHMGNWPSFWARIKWLLAAGCLSFRFTRSLLIEVRPTGYDEQPAKGATKLANNFQAAAAAIIGLILICPWTGLLLST